jgi:hypothetical protein
VRVEYGLDFPGSDLAPAAIDDLLEPSGDAQKAPPVHDGQVAGMEPSVGIDCRRRGPSMSR